MTVLEKLIEQLKELKVKSVYDLNKPPKYSGEYRIALNHAIDRCNLLLEEEQEMLKEYHKSELLKLNKSDVSSRSLMSEFWSKSADLIDNYRESNDERVAQGVISCRILINRIMTDIDNDC